VEEIRKRAVSGEDFADLARQHSDCTSKDKGGDLGFFSRHGQMVEAFASAAFKLERGGISPVVQTVFGYHVIKVTDIKPGKDVSLEEVRADVADACADRRARAIYEQLRAAAEIELPSAD
jgi:parvulin-like peptidyl-prolyl isomerase